MAWSLSKRDWIEFSVDARHQIRMQGFCLDGEDQCTDEECTVHWEDDGGWEEEEEVAKVKGTGAGRSKAKGKTKTHAHAGSPALPMWLPYALFGFCAFLVALIV